MSHQKYWYLFEVNRKDLISLILTSILLSSVIGLIGFNFYQNYWAEDNSEIIQIESQQNPLVGENGDIFWITVQHISQGLNERFAHHSLHHISQNGDHDQLLLYEESIGEVSSSLFIAKIIADHIYLSLLPETRHMSNDILRYVFDIRISDLTPSNKNLNIRTAIIDQEYWHELSIYNQGDILLRSINSGENNTILLFHLNDLDFNQLELPLNGDTLAKNNYIPIPEFPIYDAYTQSKVIDISKYGYLLSIYLDTDGHLVFIKPIRVKQNQGDFEIFTTDPEFYSPNDNSTVNSIYISGYIDGYRAIQLIDDNNDFYVVYQNETIASFTSPKDNSNYQDTIYNFRIVRVKDYQTEFTGENYSADHGFELNQFLSTTSGFSVVNVIDGNFYGVFNTYLYNDHSLSISGLKETTNVIIEDIEWYTSIYLFSAAVFELLLPDSMDVENHFHLIYGTDIREYNGLKDIDNGKIKTVVYNFSSNSKSIFYFFTEIVNGGPIERHLESSVGVL